MSEMSGPTFQPTTQGPRMVRHALKTRLQTALPPMLPILQGQWDLAAAFPPPADKADNDSPLPKADSWWTYNGRPVDRWPVIQATLAGAKVRRGADRLTVNNSMLDFVTYQASVYVWTLLEVPEGLGEIDPREWVVDQRDDLITAVRSVLLARSVQPGMRVMQNTFEEEYGDPVPGAGQRWEIASRTRFDLLSQEARSGVPVVHDGAPAREIDVEVHELPPSPPPA